MRTVAAVCFVVFVLLTLQAPLPSQESASALRSHVDSIKQHIDGDYPGLETLYKHLHANPELSYQEALTAARLAKEMRVIGFTVTEKVGGHGIVCTLKNGEGPTVLVRTDMDALPVTERTELPYASKVRMRDTEGKEIGVMHACGHDMHMTCWIGVARTLANMKDRWKGTLVFIGQPAEERGGGARAMLDDGLFTRFPKPEYCLALHCDGDAAHGTVGYTEGMALANVDSVDIIVKGKGGHGSAPHTTIDPVVIAARVVIDLQTIVSREIDPTDAAVVTVGSIHGGTKHNIIPNEVKMQLTVRTFKDTTRKHVLESIERIAKAAATAARAPEPVVRIDPGEFTPAMYNDVPLTRKTTEALRTALGADKVYAKQPVMGGEDFSQYGRAGVPICLFRLGTSAPDRVRAAHTGGRPLPSLHSDLYYPVPEPTIKAGVLAMSAAVLNLVGK